MTGKPEGGVWASPAVRIGLAYTKTAPTFQKHQFLERLTAQIRPQAIKHLAGPGEGPTLGVIGTLFKCTVDAAEGNTELFRDRPQ
jgi:hypothetical protein